MAALAALAVSFGVSAAVVYLQLRHLGLTALVLVAPALAIAAVDLVYPGGPLAPDLLQLLAWAFCVVFGQLFAQRLVRGVSDGLSPRKAFLSACKDLDGVVGPVAAATTLPAIANMAYPQLFGLIVYYLVSLSCATAAAIAAMAAAALFPYTEEFVARSNVLRERRERGLQSLDLFGQARWAFSFTGIALVLAALAGFGMRNLHFEVWPYFGVAGVFWVAALALVTRDWRMTSGSLLALALVVVLSLAARAQEDGAFQAWDVAWLSLCCASGGVVMSGFAASWSRFVREGDEVGGALTRALRDEGPVVLFAALLAAAPAVGLLALALMFAQSGQALPPYVVAMACFPAATFAVFPAVTVMLYRLLPRYRDVEEVFGKR